MSMWSISNTFNKKQIAIPSIELFNKMNFKPHIHINKSNTGTSSNFNCPISIKEKFKQIEEISKQPYSSGSRKYYKHKNISIDSLPTCFPQINESKILTIKPHTSNEYKRPQEKLRKGQNELMFERLQEKYTIKMKANSSNNVATGMNFYRKNKRLNKSLVRNTSNGHFHQEKKLNKENTQNNELKSHASNTFFNQSDVIPLKKEYESIIDKYNSFMGNKNILKNNDNKNNEEISKAINDKHNNHRSTEFLFKSLEKHMNKNQSVDSKLNNNQNPSNVYNQHHKSFSMNNGKSSFIKESINNNNNNQTQPEESNQLEHTFKNDLKIIKKSFYDSNTLQSKHENEITFYSFQKLIRPNRNHHKEKIDNSSIEINPSKENTKKHNFNHSIGSSEDFNPKESTKYIIKDINMNNVINRVLENNKKLGNAKSKDYFSEMEKGFRNTQMRKTTNTNFFSQQHYFTKNTNNNESNSDIPKTMNSIDIKLLLPHEWKKHEDVWANITQINTSYYSSDIEMHLVPPNDYDVLISSYLKLFPMLINFCSFGSLNTLNQNNVNCLSFTIDDRIQNPKLEMKKWKDAYKRVLLRWHPDKLSGMLNNIKLRDESKRSGLLKKSTMVINNMNNLLKKIMEILKKIVLSKGNQEAS